MLASVPSESALILREMASDVGSFRFPGSLPRGEEKAINDLLGALAEGLA